MIHACPNLPVQNRLAFDTPVDKAVNSECSLPVYGNVLQAVGHTPLIKLSRYLPGADFTLYGKLEQFNPGGSAKDRPARQMIEAALKRNQINSDSVIIESTSGNMGIGLAQACRYYGLKLICVVDPRAQLQNIKLMQAYGAVIELVKHPDPASGDFLTARINRVKQLIQMVPGAYWPNQYANPDNPRAHFEQTIREVDDALAGDIDYLFVATSSMGTAQGCRDYLRTHARATQVVAVDAEGSVLFGGQSGPRKLPGLGAGQIPPLAVDQQFDEVVKVTDLDCVTGCRRLVQTEALLVGGSAGGVLEAVRRLSSRLQGATCVAILADSGTRYLETVYHDEWVKQELNCTPEELQVRVSEGLMESNVSRSSVQVAY